MSSFPHDIDQRLMIDNPLPVRTNTVSLLLGFINQIGMIPDTGEELLLENREEILRHNQRLMDGFTEEEKNCLSGYLDRLYENVKKESEETGE